jgi:hypothetical protein
MPTSPDNGRRSPRKLLAASCAEARAGASGVSGSRRASLLNYLWRARSDRATLMPVGVAVGVALLAGIVAVCASWVWSERRSVSDYVNRIPLPRSLPSLAPVASIIGGIAGYFAASSRRLQMSRLGRSADGIIVVPMLGLALVLGVFAATAATKGSSANADSPVATIASDDASEEVVRQTHLVTVTTPGKKKRVTVERVRTRVVKRPGGTSTLFESVAVPGASQTTTVTGPTKTVTVAGPTETITETVTTVLTVTETVEEDKEKP